MFAPVHKVSVFERLLVVFFRIKSKFGSNHKTCLTVSITNTTCNASVQADASFIT